MLKILKKQHFLVKKLLIF